MLIEIFLSTLYAGELKTTLHFPFTYEIGLTRIRKADLASLSAVNFCHDRYTAFGWRRKITVRVVHTCGVSSGGVHLQAGGISWRAGNKIDLVRIRHKNSF